MRRGTRVLCKMLATMACATAVATGCAGCSLLTPPLSEVQAPTVHQTIDNSLLVTPGTLTVALDTSDAPQAMSSADGELVGYAVDVARALSQKLGVDVQLVSASSPDKPITSGEADIYLGAAEDDAGSGVTVTGTYLESATAVFGTRPASGALTADDLAAATVGVQSGSATEEVVYNVVPTSQVRTYANINECFDALAAGEVDYVACDATAGAYLARAQRDVSFCGALSNADAYGIAFSSRATELADDVMSAFSQLESDGTLDAIRCAWYGDLPSNLEDQLIDGVDPAAAEDHGLTFDDDATDDEDGADTDTGTAAGTSATGAGTSDTDTAAGDDSSTSTASGSSASTTTTDTSTSTASADGTTSAR
ncbi:transporter substrate-binding domain-containing protein [Collinsella sp. An2]|uniref:substrate-binding periplasmic protein n=1 Tax=Collinsella sp. An2 TaxID=1965585 RepID=UPI000B56352F|nr:transporter substrate-binding domain-containing protein [Collinsella sp. An2]OUP09502.1 hypothetical protein B5F33_04885 [Collinsella sp. An2]